MGIKNAFCLIAFIWTIIVATLFIYSHIEHQKVNETLALYEARASYHKDVAYRQWATHHGGVYVPITPVTPPNPNLAHLKDRDVNTTDGKQLTLINPAYMTRQVHELPETQYGIKGKLTSLQSVRPRNAPDGWEAQALLKLKAGAGEFYELSSLDNAPHLRYMGPMKANDNCLKCHRTQGYKIGDVIGGVSIAVPWKPYETLVADELKQSAAGYGLLWLFGSSVLLIAFIYLRRGTSELQRRETLWRLALEGAQQGVWDWNVQTGQINYSDRWKQMLGYEPGEITPRIEEWENRVHPDDLAEAKTQIERHLKGETPYYESEHRLRCKDGRYRWTLDRGVVIERGRDGEAIRMVGTQSDISAKHEMLLQVSQAQKEAKRYLDIVEVAMVVLDKEGIVRLANPAACRLIGAEAADILGKEWFGHFLPERLCDQVREVFVQIVREKWQEPLLYENPIVTIGGEERLISWRSTVIFDAQGEFAGVLAAGTDITEERQAQQALEKLNLELEHRVEQEVARRQQSERTMLHQSRVAAMGEMISAIAHHWRQPLNVVALNIQGLRDDLSEGTLDEARLETVIAKSMEKITEMSLTIDSLRGLISNGQEKVQCCVLEELKLAYQLLKAELAVGQIEVEGFCFGEGPQPLENCFCKPENARWVRIVPADFRQAIFNILINARDAILERRKKNGGPQQGIIRIRLDFDGGFEAIEIEDNGGGFAPGAIEHIFDPFFSTKERGSGKGLITGVGMGLYLTKMVVEEHMGGTIRAENGPDGARLIIRLPLEKKD